MLRELSATYSDVTSTVIDMVLESCQFNRTMAVGVLNSMSSKKASTAAPSPKVSRVVATVVRGLWH